MLFKKGREHCLQDMCEGRAHSIRDHGHTHTHTRARAHTHARTTHTRAHAYTHAHTDALF